MSPALSLKNIQKQSRNKSQQQGLQINIYCELSTSIPAATIAVLHRRVLGVLVEHLSVEGRDRATPDRTHGSTYWRLG